MDCSPPGSSVHGIFQARILEWVSISFSTRSSWPRDWTHVFCVSYLGRRILYHFTTWEVLFKVLLLLLLLLLSHFSHAWLCATPEMAAQSCIIISTSFLMKWDNWGATLLWWLRAHILEPNHLVQNLDWFPVSMTLGNVLHPPVS